MSINTGAVNNHKRTKSVNPTVKIRSNFVQTPKKTTLKKEVPFKNNVNKSTSMNKHLDNSMIGNSDSVNNTTFQPHNLQNEFNSIKTNKGRNGVAEKKIGREPRNLSMNKNKGQPSHLRKEVSNEKKGKFLI